MGDDLLAGSDLRLSMPACEDAPYRAPMGFCAVVHVTRGLDCPCCKDRRTKREIQRTARRVAKQRGA